MSVQPNYNEFSFCSLETYNKQTEVECKITAPSEIKNVVAVKGTASPVSEETVENDVRYSGRAVFCVIYEDAEGALAKAECGVEFTDKYENAEDAGSVKFTDFTVTGEEVRFVNGGYVVQAVVNARMIAEKHKEVSALTGGENVLCDFVEKNLKSVTNENRAALQTDGEFELNYPVKDVLEHNASVYVSGVQSGIGTIIIDGTLFLSMTVLQNSEKNVIVKEQKSISFRQEMEMRSVSPSSEAYAMAAVSRSAIKVVVDEEKGTSTVIASFDIDAYGFVYENIPVRFARDAYSVKNEITVNNVKASNGFVAAQYGVSEKVTALTDYETAEGAEAVAVTGEKVENVTVNTEANAITGIISATVIEKTESGYTGKRVVAPFEIPFGGSAASVYRLFASTENFNRKAKNAAEFEFTLKIAVTEYAEEEYGMVSEIVAGEEKQEKTTAVSVYVARGNDTVWDVCKELGVSAEVIAALNPDVTFPLTGSERIIVYRNL